MKTEAQQRAADRGESLTDAIGRDHTRCVACRAGIRYSHNPIVARVEIGPLCPHEQFVACSVCRLATEAGVLALDIKAGTR